MSKVFTAITGAVLGVATWFLLFVILGVALGTSFIAGGVVLAAGVIGALMIAASERGMILDSPLTSTGLLAGIGAFAVLEIVLSVPMWVGVVTGLGVIGIYDMVRANIAGIRRAEAQEPVSEVSDRRLHAPAATRNGHDNFDREPVGVR